MWKYVKTLQGNSHSNGGEDMVINGLPVEVEGGELLLQHDNGSVGVVPKRHAGYVKNLISQNSPFLDQYMDSLQKMGTYANNGTIVPLHVYNDVYPGLDGDKEKMLSYMPGLKNAYGNKLEYLDIYADRNYKASDYGYGNVEYMNTWQDSVRYSNNYSFPNHSHGTGRSSIVFNPDYADMGDVLLDAASHGFNSDPLHQEVVKTVMEDSKHDIEMFYNKDSGLSYEEFANNWADGKIRAYIARQDNGIPLREELKKDYDKEYISPREESVIRDFYSKVLMPGTTNELLKEKIKLADGGVIKNPPSGKIPPLFVDDANDPRYKSYQDSLSLYNKYLKSLEFREEEKELNDYKININKNPYLKKWYELDAEERKMTGEHFELPGYFGNQVEKTINSTRKNLSDAWMEAGDKYIEDYEKKGTVLYNKYEGKIIPTIHSTQLENLDGTYLPPKDIPYDRTKITTESEGTNFVTSRDIKPTKYQFLWGNSDGFNYLPVYEKPQQKIFIKGTPQYDAAKKQEELVNAGYNIGPTGIDGDWGKNSQKAWDEYQKTKTTKPVSTTVNNPVKDAIVPTVTPTVSKSNSWEEKGYPDWNNYSSTVRKNIRAFGSTSGTRVVVIDKTGKEYPMNEAEYAEYYNWLKQTRTKPKLEQGGVIPEEPKKPWWMPESMKNKMNSMVDRQVGDKYIQLTESMKEPQMVNDNIKRPTGPTWLQQGIADSNIMSDVDFEKKYKTHKHGWALMNSPEYAAEVEANIDRNNPSTIDYPKTSYLSRNYQGNPNLQYTRTNQSGTDMIKTMEMAHMDAVGAALPIPGLDAMGKIPSIFKAGKNLIKPVSKVVNKVDDVTKIVTNNLKDLEYAKNYYSKFGYDIPENLAEIAKDSKLTDETIQGLVNQHNTFVRGVSTNWDEIAKKNPEILRHLEGKGIDYINNPQAAAEYMSTHVPIETGYGRAGFGKNSGNINAIYTSNSIPTAEGYTYGDGYIVKVKRPTDFSSKNRIEWIKHNDFDYDNVNKTADVQSVNDVIALKTYYQNNTDKIDDILPSNYPLTKEEILNLPQALRENQVENIIKVTIPEEKQSLYGFDAMKKPIRKMESKIDMTTNDYYDLIDDIEDDVLYGKIADRFKQEETRLNKKLHSLVDNSNEYEYGSFNWYKSRLKYQEEAQKIMSENKDEYIKILQDEFGITPNRYAHYLHIGKEGDKLLEPIEAMRITPDIWKNKSRAHTNVFSKGLSAGSLIPFYLYLQSQNKNKTDNE